MALIRLRAILVVLALTLSAAVSHGQTTGSPAADAIIRLNQPRGDSVVGNSVDAGTGNFAFSVQAVKIDGGRELGFTLLYDSIVPLSGLVARPRTLGPGWTHEYAARIVGTPASQIVEVNWDDNRRNRFRLEGGEYVPVEEAVRFDRLRQVDGLAGCSDCFWEVRRPDGTLYQFAETGELLRLGNKIRQYIELEYEGDRLVRLVEPISDRKLEFTYTNGARGRILYVSDPAERRTYFSYDPRFGRLLTIHNPAEISGPYGPAFVPKPIPDNSPGGLVHTISVDTSEPVGIVALGAANIGHQRVDDLMVFLESPEGTRIEISGLANRPSASVLDFAGVALSDFHGENPNGTWIVNVVDTAAGQTGELNGWAFELTSLSYPTHFSYNANSSILLQSFDAEGDRIFANLYDAFNRVAAQDDGLDSTPMSTFSYAPTMRGGAITTYVDRLGQEQIFEHDAEHRLRRYVNELGAETTYSYDPAGNRTSIIDPLGRTTGFEYDSDGNVEAIIDPEQHTSRMEYDSNNNLLTFRDARGKVTTFAYTTNNNVRRITDAEGNEDQKTYNGSSQLIGNILHDGAGVDYSYNGGQATGAKRLNGGGSGEGADYSSIGLPTTLTDGEGNEIKLEYDTRGLVVKQTDQMDRVETMEYDARRRLVRKTDRNGGETSFTYDANGNRLSQTNALGQTTEFEYDQEDRLVRVVDPRGNASTRTYDAAGRVIERTDALGNTTRLDYDVVGNEIARYDAEGLKVTGAVYSDRDLLLSLEDAVGNVTTTDYNALKQPVSITDPAGRTSRFRFDDIGRLVEVEDPLGRVYEQSYHSDDIVASITDAAGRTSTFDYDQANRLNDTRPPPGGSAVRTRIVYDERGLPLEEQLPGGLRRCHDYDDAGLLTRTEYRDGNCSSGTKVDPDLDFAYDANGNLETVSVDSTDQLERSFDGLNRVTSFRDAHGDTIRYVYDAAGNLTRIVYPDGKTVEYVFDEANRIVEVVDWADRSTTFAYDSSSRLTEIIFPNGTMRTLEYDAAGRITLRRDLAPPGRIIVEYSYAYDALSSIVNEQSSLLGPGYFPRTLSLTYDNNGMLATVDGVAADHDPRGNLTGVQIGDDFRDFEYDLDDNLVAVDGAAYEYDAEDHLIAYPSPGGRVRLTVNPHAALSQVLVKRGGGSPTARYVYAGGLLYDEVNGEIRVYHYDQRGATVAFSDASGAVVGEVAYGPFGEIIERSGDSDSPFLFGGLYGVLTDSNDLNYMRFRWYSPQLKRFLSRDAHFGDITDASQLNRYIFAGNNPVNFNDPNGEFLQFLVAAVVGAVVNVVATVVSSVVTGQPLTAGDLIGAAVGGAVTGVLASTGVGLIAAGAAGGIVGNLAKQGVNNLTGDQQGFDLVDFGVEVGLSAIPFPAGKGAKATAGAVSRGARRASVSNLFKRTGKTAFPELEVLLNKATFKSILKETVAQNQRQLLSDLGVAAGLGILQSVISQAREASSPGTSSSSPGNLSIRQQSRRELNAGRRGVAGEFAAWQFYQAAYALAGRPLPNNPNNPLAQF